MKILILVKAVRSDLVFDDVTDKGNFTINPYDLFALQHILETKSKEDSVTCMSMGHSGAKAVLEKCLALGADEVIWLSDRLFSGADTVATTYSIAFAIQKQTYDLIVCGEKAVDGETSQVPGGIAERLDLSYVSGVTEINSMASEEIIITRKNGLYLEKIKAPLPILLSINNFTTKMNTISMANMRKAHRKEIIAVTAEGLGISPSKCGTKGSKTIVLHTDSTVVETNDNRYYGDIHEFSDCVVELMRSYQ